jgi:hypothetical protein
MAERADEADDKEPSALVAHASALEEELAHFEALVGEAGRLELISEPTLQRARQVLEDCAASERRMADQLHAFVSAMQAIQERQRVCMLDTVQAAERIRARITERNALLERFGALGERAGAVNAPVAAVMEGNLRGASASELATALGEVVTRTDAIVESAAEVAADARAASWEDIAKEADGLRAQVEAARDKVLAARRSLAGGEAS